MTAHRLLVAISLLSSLAGCSVAPSPPAAFAFRLVVPVVDAAPVAAQTAPAPPTTSAADTTRGRQIYLHYCSHCHDSGAGHPGTMRLAVRIDDGRAALLGRSDLSPEYVHHVVRNGLGMMPPFRPTEISDQALASLAAYLGQNFISN